MDNQPPQQATAYSVNPNDQQSILQALSRLFGKGHIKQARSLLLKLSSLQGGASRRWELVDMLEPIKLLAADKHYLEALFLLNSYEKYVQVGQAVHFGNPLHVSLPGTKSAQRWEDFFGEVIPPQAVIEKLFDLSITAEHQDALEHWRTKHPAPNCVTFGSCFAREIANAISDLGYVSNTLHLEESINTPKATLAILKLIESGSGNDYLQGRMKGRHQDILHLIHQANLVVITVGVGFYYVDNNDELYIGKGYGQKIESGEIRAVSPPVEELIETLVAIHEKLMALSPDALKIVTLSPVPISGYVGEPGMFVADCVSKSKLRSAIHSALEKTSFVYLPTFEALKWIAPHMLPESKFRPFADSRHPNEFLVNAILSYVLRKNVSAE